MKINRITMMGVLAALALIMMPGFAAQAASLDVSPDIPAVAGGVEAPDVEDVDVADIGGIEAPEIEAPEVEAPEIETPDVAAPEVEAPELGE